jgi:hypothetical protein
LQIWFDGVIPDRFRFPDFKREVERIPDQGDGLAERRGTDTECSFDDARLAADVARKPTDQ